MQFNIEHDLDKDSNKLLIILIVADVVFIVFHCFHRYTGLLPSFMFSLWQERGYPEIYQYIKETSIVILLFYLFFKKLKILYLMWSLILFYIVLDDSFQLHERWGLSLVNYFDLKSKYGLISGDIGQLFVFIIIGSFFLINIGILHYLSNSHDRKTSTHLIIFLALLAAFGIFIDYISIIFQSELGLYALIEEGGEMFIMSIITWYVYKLKISENNN